MTRPPAQARFGTFAQRAAALCAWGVVVVALCSGCSRDEPAAEMEAEEPERVPGSAHADRAIDPVHVDRGFREALLTGQARAETDAHVASGGSCAGWMSASEGHLIELEREVALEFRVAAAGRPLIPLGLAVTSQADAHGGTDGLRCVPAAPQGSVLRFGELSPGRWFVRVLVDEAAAPLDYRLRLAIAGQTDGGADVVVPREGGEPVRTTGEGRWGGARVGPQSAPVLWTGRAGGPRPAEGLGLRCAGWIAETPDHVLELSHGMPLRLQAEASEGVTIAVRREDGVWVCSDEHSVRQPRLLVALAAGRHEVFVGSLDPHGDPEYSLRVSR